ncbi:MAG: 3-oxoacyl-[acyl-carrier-protein] reductase [Spirochaetes bacterium]|nr:3-oxoacyl-[acyl-carrier-protein] reductase [Spirochaetota bacterium]
MDFGIKGKAAIVTGSARGIGRSIAEKLAAEGANLVITDVNEEMAKATAGEIASKYGVKAVAFKHDVSKSDSTEAVMDGVMKEYGKIDILVNNAGITRDTLMMRMKDEDWDLVIKINLTGVFNCTKAAIRHMMKARSGSIVNIASVVGIMGNAGQANYSASKGGVIALTKTTAKEVAPRNITVNAIAPGFINTDMTKSLPKEVTEKFLTVIPFGRYGEPDEVADAVLFYCSNLARYITGTVLPVDGGMVM